MDSWYSYDYVQKKSHSGIFSDNSPLFRVHYGVVAHRNISDFDLYLQPLVQDDILVLQLSGLKKKTLV